MEEIELVKKYSGWQNVRKVLSDSYKFYFQSPFGELSEIIDVMYFYTCDYDNYLIVVSKNSYFVACKHDKNIIWCFIEVDSLQEACEAL